MSGIELRVIESYQSNANLPLPEEPSTDTISNILQNDTDRVLDTEHIVHHEIHVTVKDLYQHIHQLETANQQLILLEQTRESEFNMQLRSLQLELVDLSTRNIVAFLCPIC